MIDYKIDAVKDKSCTECKDDDYHFGGTLRSDSLVGIMVVHGDTIQDLIRKGFEISIKLKKVR